MKTLLLGATLALAMTSAISAPANPQGSTQNSKAQAVPPTVTGVWRSDERNAQVSPGTLTLSADGKVTLAPDGFDPLVGTYKVKGRFLDIKTDRGQASIIYTLSANAMMLEYENGSVQNFKKQSPGRNAAATIKKDAKK